MRLLLNVLGNVALVLLLTHAAFTGAQWSTNMVAFVVITAFVVPMLSDTVQPEINALRLSRLVFGALLLAGFWALGWTVLTIIHALTLIRRYAPQQAQTPQRGTMWMMMNEGAPAGREGEA